MARLEIIVDSGGARRNVDDLTQSLNRTEAAGNRVTNITQQVTVNIRNVGEAANQSTRSVDNMTRSMSGAADAAKRVAAAVAVGFGASAIFAASEAYTGLNNKLKLVTDSQFALKAAYKDVFDISQATASSIEATAGIYQNFAKNADVLGLSQRNIASITKTVSQAVAISGGNAASAAAALTQFSQSLASGVFRGEEFNSVAEQAPGLLKAIASGLNLTSGELRKMANEGKLTAEVVTGALEKSAESVQLQFNKMALTVSQGVTQINNAKIDFFGSETSEAAAALAKSLSLIAHNFDELAKVGLAAAVVIGGKAFIAGTAAVVGSVKATWNSIAANRAAAIAEADKTAQLLRSAIAEKSAALAEMTRARDSILIAEQKILSQRAIAASEIARMQSTIAAYQAEKMLEVGRLQAQITDTGRQMTIARMAALQRAQAVATAELAAAELALTRITVTGSAEYAAARSLQTAATNRLTLATAGLQAATVTSTAAAGAAAAATSTLAIAGRGLLGVMTGHIGLVVMIAAVAAGFIFMGSEAEKAKPKLDELGNTADEISKKFGTLNREQREGFLAGVNDNLKKEAANVKTTTEEMVKDITDLANPMFASRKLPLIDIANMLRSGVELEEVMRRVRATGLVSEDELDKLRVQASSIVTSKLAIRDLSEQKIELVATNTKLSKSTDLLNEKDREAELKRVASINRMKVADKDRVKQAEENAKRVADINDPTEEGKARRQIAADEANGIKNSKEANDRYIASAKLVDKAQAAVKDSKKSMNAETKEENALLRESTAELNRQKNAYLSLAESQLDPIEAINKKYREQIDLINKAASGRFKATGAAATSGSGLVDYASDSKPLALNMRQVSPETIRKSIIESGVGTQADRDKALSDFEAFMTKRNDLFQKESSAGINISRAEGDARVALVKMQQAADINMYNAQYTQQLASLSDYAKSAQDILDEKLESDKLKNENSYITDVNGAQKRADMLLAIEKKFAHDSAEILIQRTQERTAILQGLQDKRDTTAFGEQNAVASALGGSTQAGINQNVFAIQQKVQQDIAAEQDKMREDMAAADRKAANDKIALIQQVGDAEIADAQRTSAAVLDTRSALLAAGTAIEDGIAQSLTKAIIQGDNLRETLRGVAISGAEMLLQSMIKIGLQHGVNALLEVGARQLVTTANVAATAIETATTVGAVAAVTPVVVASQTAIATAAAPAAAGVSIATLGMGAIIALGAVAAVYALTKGFSGGGYTGDGGVNDPAGIVHKGEVVWSQNDIRRAGGVDAVESMRRGMQTSYMQDVAPQRMQSSNQTPQAQNPVINIHNHGIDEAIEDWFKGSSSDKHFVNKFERNKSSMRMA